MNKSTIKSIAAHMERSANDAAVQHRPLTMSLIHQRVFKNVLQRQGNVSGNAVIDLSVVTLLDMDKVEYIVTIYDTGLHGDYLTDSRYKKLHDAIDAYNAARGL